MSRGKKVDIEKYLTNIEDYLKIGCSLPEACSLGHIPYTTVKDYYDNDQNIRNKIECWKNNVFSVARRSVYVGMQEDPKLALEFLKNKKSDEFGTKEKKELSGEIELKNININFVKPNDK